MDFNRSYAFSATHHFQLSGQIWGVSYCFFMCAVQYKIRKQDTCHGDYDV